MQSSRNWLLGVAAWTALFVLAQVPCAGRLSGPWVFWGVALLSFEGLVHAATLALALLFVASLMPTLRASRVVVAVLGGTLLLFVQVDAIVYGDFGYHLVGRGLTWLFHGDGLTTLGVTAVSVVQLAGVLAAAIALGVFATRTRLPRRLGVKLFLPVLLVDLSAGVGSMCAQFDGVRPLMGLAEAMPLGFSPDLDPLLSRVLDHGPIATNDELQFPPVLVDPVHYLALKPAPFPTTAARRPNILIMVIESLRADALPAMPHVEQFARTALVADDHYSSGNCSFLGDFPLMTGLTPDFWGVTGTAESPRGLAAFEALGYQVRICQSAALIFGMPERVVPEGKGVVVGKVINNPLSRDEQTLACARDWLSSPDPAPRIAVMFFDGSHWPYWVPGEPTPHFDLVDGWDARKVAPRYRARYFRSLHAVDDKVGAVLKAVRDAGLGQKLAIVITGDHGEAFGEHGLFSHGLGLYDEELRTPLLMRLPGIAPGHLSGPSTHADILPTLLGYLGAKPLPQLPGTGVDLLAQQPRRVPPLVGSCVIDTADGFAALVPEGKILFQLGKEHAHYVGFVSPNGTPVARSPDAPEIRAVIDAEYGDLRASTIAEVPVSSAQSR